MSKVHSVLEALENESIEILSETATAFRKPVMLYSIGKDSSVLLRLARKAFAPGPIPFPLMHIDTTWIFKEMISFRVVKEVTELKLSERATRFTDGDREDSMVEEKTEGYF